MTRSAVEGAAQAVWAAVLEVERVDRDSDFFELGGDSLRAAQLTSRLSDELRIDVPLRIIFDRPVFGQFVEALVRAAPSIRTGSWGGVTSGRESEFPSSINQEQRLRLAPDGAVVCNAFNPHVAFRLRGTLDAAVLERGVAALCERQEALRTRIAMHDGLFVQRTVPSQIVQLEMMDLSAADLDERLRDGRASLSEVVRRRFDLTHDAPMRVAVASVASDDHLLVLCFSHAVCDGWSLQIVARDLSRIYRALAAVSAPPFEPLPQPWRSWVLKQRRWVASEEGAAAVDYWRRKLAGCSPIPETRLPGERPILETETRGRAASVFAFFSDDEIACLERFVRARQATVYMGLLTLLKSVIAEATGRTDVAVVTPFANRRSIDDSDLVGWLSFSVPLRTEIGGAASFADRLTRVRATVIEAQEHPLPYSTMIARLAPELVGSRKRRPTVVLSFEDERALRLDLPGVQAELFELEGEGWSHPGLYWFFARRDGGVRLELRYEAEAITRGDSERLVELFAELLRTVPQS